jgi:regulatory protein SWI5
VSAASIADLDLNMAKTDTGVSQGIIDSYVAGPDAENKYTCTFEDCHKKFGRKENIKSHIQTHLNDRQFECPICNNRFVRQHDLKRHAKIHTGCKPYECACGCTFARHDALTRHRQRGMCVGAFEGIVRKVVKRGRPRKVRPGMDERVEKSARTRVKNRIKAETSSASSQSGYSDSSAANSPGNDFDDAMDMELMDVDVYDQLLRSMPATVGLDSAGLTATAASMAPEEILAVLSPEHAVSPSALSQHSPASHVSLAEIQENMARHGSHPASPAKSVASHYTHQPSTPPELSLSSSPPGARFGDHEHNSSGFVDPDSSLIMITSATNGLALTSTAPAGLANTSLDDEMLMKAFTNEDAQGLVQIGGQPSEYEMSMGMNMTMFDDDPYFINA